MRRNSPSILLVVLLVLSALPAAAQIGDDGAPLQPSPLPGLDDPPGTKLRELPLPKPRMHGLTMIGDLLYGIYQTSATLEEIYELDTATGAVKSTITLSGYPAGAWLYGLGWDVRRNCFVMGDTSIQGLALADTSGKVTTFYATPGDRNVGAAYDTHRDGYWLCAWNTNTLKLYDARNLPAVLVTINLAAVGCTTSAGVAFSPVNDVVYVNSRTTNMGYVFDATTGRLLVSYAGVSSGYGSAWWDRWQCPVVVEEGISRITYKDAGYPRVDAATSVPIGKVLAIQWKADGSPGRIYKAAASFTERIAGIRFFNRYLPIAVDNLFFLSLQLPAVFVRFEGVLDPGGTAAGALAVPNAPALAGITLSIAWLTADPAAPLGVHAISGPWQVAITK
ncbi:MAG: hypothetical protein JXQ29_04950 [Planctomycetes bacterium]|nr:hypothetical protein [Planctomycetota bacterium]